MHIFFAIVAAGITLYLLRGWWESRDLRRALRELKRQERARQRALQGPDQSAPVGLLLFAIVLFTSIAIGTAVSLVAHH